MAKLSWHESGEHKFELGLDRGVLYIPQPGQSSLGIPWSGLISVDEQFDESLTAHYMDGIKFLESESLGDFSASLKAFTYPDEFERFNGTGYYGSGLFVHDQKPKSFGLSFRTFLGNDINGLDHGYKIHILFNLTAIQEALSYETLSDKFGISVFGWTLKSVPSHVGGFRPTAHLVIDSTEIDSELLTQIENILYGTNEEDARLLTLSEFVEMAIAFASITVVDNGDGTWTATGLDRWITMLDESTFQITDVDVVYSNAYTYEISTTFHHDPS